MLSLPTGQTGLPKERVTKRDTKILHYLRPMYKKSLTKEQALQKLKHYCAYQERAHS